MRIEPSDLAWLQSSGLVDRDVDLDAVRPHTAGPPSWWVRSRRLSAITLGNHIWFSAPEHQRSRALLVHELVHVAQYRRLTTPVFCLRYFVHSARRGFRYSRDLPFEAPAYARQAQARALIEVQRAREAGAADPTYSI
ncbi:MAG TPA: DUF4157 domain-containing protein [Tepidiformaceae bacterium]|nr:DUF4157 domain-containing protein [Tepidiformaceae bacterium]